VSLHSVPVVDAKSNDDDQNYNDEGDKQDDVESEVFTTLQVCILVA